MILKRRNIIVVVLGVIAVGILASAGYLFWPNRKLKSQITNPSTQPSSADGVSVSDATADWRAYRNEKYGFGWRYLLSWGEPQEKVIVIEPNEYERGKHYRLTFRGNPRVRGGGVSSDYTVPTEGSEETFGGDPQKPKGISSSIYVGLPGCEERYFQTYNGWVEFNLPGKEISGFRLILPILSQAEIEKFSRLYPINGDGFCPVGSKELEQAKQHAGDILKKIETGDIDKESRENLQIFKDVIKSAYVF